MVKLISITVFVAAIAFLTWLLIHEVFYSPKAQIKRLWKEVFVLTHKMSKYNSSNSFVDSIVKDPYEKVIHKKKQMINALLDYHFDLEEDQEYIEENRS